MTLRILLVDDNPDLLHLFAHLLREAGHTVDTAAHGQLALDYLHAHLEALPDLVLMDIQMPILDGLQATRALRADPDLEDLSVIALTAQGLPDEVDLGLEAGCDGYIVKPLDPSELLDELALVLASLTSRA